MRLFKTSFIYVTAFVLILSGTNLFAGNNNHSNEIGTAASGSSKTNDDYKLYNNFPNPFNPVTKISYKINQEGFVSLQVYNLVGQVLSVLVNENQKPGRYEVTFDGANLTTGIYLYKLQVNDFTSVKRMTLLK